MLIALTCDLRAATQMLRYRKHAREFGDRPVLRGRPSHRLDVGGLFSISATGRPGRIARASAPEKRSTCAGVSSPFFGGS